MRWRDPVSGTDRGAVATLARAPACSEPLIGRAQLAERAERPSELSTEAPTAPAEP
jgi:hypothetical protein